MFFNYSVIIGFVGFLTVLFVVLGIVFFILRKRTVGICLFAFSGLTGLFWLSLYGKHKDDNKRYMGQYAGIYSIYTPYSNFGSFDSSYFQGTKFHLQENGRFEIISPVKQINKAKGEWEVDTDGDIFWFNYQFDNGPSFTNQSAFNLTNFFGQRITLSTKPDTLFYKTP